MKVLLAILAVLLLAACGGTEIKTTPIEVQEVNEPVSEPEHVETAPEPAVVEPKETITEPEPAPEPTPARDPGKEACQAYIDRLIEDVDDAKYDLKDAEKEYIDADEKFEDVLDKYGANHEQTIEAKEEREKADKAEEDAEDALYGAERKLRKARDECGIY